jgi:hypothetical protein
MDSRIPQGQTVTVLTADDQENRLTTIHIPRSFTDEWQTSDPKCDSPTKKHTFMSLIKPHLWFIDTALLLAIASLLLLSLFSDRGTSEQDQRVSSPSCNVAVAVHGR